MSRPQKITIRTRLTLWYGAVFLATGAALLTLVYLLVNAQLVSANTQLVARIAAVEAAGPAPDTKPITSPGLRPTQTPAPDHSSPLQRLCAPFETPADPKCLQAGPPGAVVNALVDDTRHDVLRAIVAKSGLAFVAMAVFALALCWLVAGRALRPLRRITGAASRLSHETLGSRIALDGPEDELKILADTFDAMLDRLGTAFETQQLFAANASHELRTPLTIIQVAADQALSRHDRSEADYRKALTTIATAVRRGERLLAGLLALAQARRQSASELLDLAAAANDATAAWPTGDPVLNMDLSEAPVSGDRVLIGLLLRNLLENAARYNVAGGAVWVTTASVGDRAVLRVENTGPQIDSADLPSLRESFQRGAQRTGSGTSEGFGLGLAIVGAIVAAHWGTWALVARDAGGLIVTVNMPRGAAPPKPISVTRPQKSSGGF